MQAFELLQGNLVRFSSDSATKDVPTAVLVHGILGSRRNLQSFARMIVEVRCRNADMVTARCFLPVSACAPGRGALKMCCSKPKRGAALYFL